MRDNASELARRLGWRAEALCRRYLSNGRRNGNYWQVGDVRNTPGRSMFVRLKNSAKGLAGKWSDAATHEHGDLLDVISHSCGLTNFPDVLDEARAFLGIVATPAAKPEPPPDRYDLVASARKLFAFSRPIEGSLAETYLRQRGVADFRETAALRFHPRCFYRDDRLQMTQWPAMIAAVTDLDGQITGVHRTYLARDGFDKAPLDPSRKAMGDLLSHGVRFGAACDVVAVGEGIETVLALRQALPGLPAIAALSADHLGAVLPPKTVRTLYIARDNDCSGARATARLIQRAAVEGFEVCALSPKLGDFNDDLRAFGVTRLRENLLAQLDPKDCAA